MFPLSHKTAAPALVLSCVGLAGCPGQIIDEGGAADPVEMQGAGGRNIAEYWTRIDVPLSQNTRMLNVDMLRSEVNRATGRSWVENGVDLWDRNRGALGGADYKTTFADDLTPSQQRLVLVRKMAFSVCSDLVAAESGATATRTVFTELDPGAALDVAAARTTTQITQLYRRFFLEDATDADLADARALLVALSPDGSSGTAAWRGLCASYLASMRFLTY